MGNIIKANAKQLQQAFELEKQNAISNNIAKIGNTTNNNAVIHKCNYMLYLLDAVPTTTVFKVEGCKNDNFRGFNLANTGSLVETLINGVCDGFKQDEYSKAWDAQNPDLTLGIMNYEIKSILDSHFKNTKVSFDKPVLLLNRAGISVIAKSDIQNHTDKYGRFKANQLYGKRNHPLVIFLERALGIEGGYEE